MSNRHCLSPSFSEQVNCFDCQKDPHILDPSELDDVDANGLGVLYDIDNFDDH